MYYYSTCVSCAPLFPASGTTQYLHTCGMSLLNSINKTATHSRFPDLMYVCWGNAARPPYWDT